MKAIILVAGQGERLQPYTNDRPKCMVPLAGRPLLHWQIAVLNSAGIENITLVGGYRADKLDAQYTSLLINRNFATTNMVTTLFCAKELMDSSDDLLICYGDIVYEKSVLETVIKCDAEVCVAADREWKRLWSLRMENPLEDAETFRMDQNNRVIELGNKPKSYDEIQAQYMGLIKVRADYLEKFVAFYEGLDRKKLYQGKNFENMYMTSFIQYLIDYGADVKAGLVDGGWLEVDTAKELKCYAQMIKENTLKPFFDVGSLDVA